MNLADSYVAWYVGCPRAGKTYLALQHARAEAARTGLPLLVVDSTHEQRNFPGIPRALGLEDALIGLHSGEARELAWTPDTNEQVDALARALLAVGRLHVLVDEAAFWLSSSKGRGGPLLRLMRAHGHVPITLHLTTQHLSGDVPAEALSCAPRVYVFRCTSRPALNLLESEYGLDRLQVQALPQYQFLTLQTGFS